MDNRLNLHPSDRETIQRLFAEPPVEFGNGPLWVWNDRMTGERIASDLKSFAAQNVRHAFIHPRPGLMTPYLSDEWLDMYEASIREAEKLGMLLWIYDENSYPSGFAGGLVPDVMPESRAKGMNLKRVRSIDPKTLPDDLYAVFALEESDGKLTAKEITGQVKNASETLTGDFALATIELARTSPWYGGKYYVDLLKPGVTEKFLEITMEPYRKRFGDKFGKTILGDFTDEPHLRVAGGITWSDGLDERYEKRWGRSLRGDLPALFLPAGDYMRIRWCFYQLLNEEFCDRWGKVCHDYCERNNLAFTGHYWEHGWPDTTHASDTMAMYQWHQVPAIDILMNEYNTDTHAQFGNNRAVRELASVANQMGRHRKLCELYGAGGWDLRFEDMKRIGDWIYVLGVNVLNQHLSYSTIRGARKRDHPQSFSYHAPWWEAYHISAKYFERLAVALSSGEQVSQILVLEPTTSSWIYLTPDGERDPNLKRLGERFQNLVNKLEDEQIEYDIGSEDLMLRHGSVTEEGLRIGQRVYTTVVIPEDMETIDSKTLELLLEFKGLTISLRDNPPTLVEGAESDKPQALIRQPELWTIASPGDLAGILRERHPGMPLFTRDAERSGILFHHRRICKDGELLFLINTSLKESSTGRVSMQGGGFESMDIESGETAPAAFTREGDTVTYQFDIAPAGSQMLFVPQQQITPAVVKQRAGETIAPKSAPLVLRAEPNVLTLDFCSAKAGGQSIGTTYFYKAQRFIFAQHGLDHNPWDSSVQFKDELITKTFPPDSGFEAEFQFTIGDDVPDELWAVVERPDLYAITLNGHPLLATPGAWFLDRCFGRIDIAGAAKTGTNVLKLAAKPMSIYHELEPVYILGEFRLEPQEQGFKIVPDKPLTLGPWSKQGHPFYSSRMIYREEFVIENPQGNFAVNLGDWWGSVAKVEVNGQDAGYIGWQPWQRKITPLINQGTNVVEVTVYGTLKNTLGPHHNNPPLGRAWPSMFQQGPDKQPGGNAYHVVDYGLFEPFTLERIV